ncbi:MAG: hypothetical protein GX575_06710 [Candidatus Anammoximicrobium sp.]|nr:hypothetical protein [Candidatus Anammoximicrobium sp.]
MLYHGTVHRFLESIRRDGLVKVKRHHVRLSPDIQTARKSANAPAGRSSCASWPTACSATGRVLSVRKWHGRYGRGAF